MKPELVRPTLEMTETEEWARNITNAFQYKPTHGISLLLSYREQVLAREHWRVTQATDLANHAWAASYAFRTVARERRAQLELKRTMSLLRYLREREAPTLTAAET